MKIALGIIFGIVGSVVILIGGFGYITWQGNEAREASKRIEAEMTKLELEQVRFIRDSVSMKLIGKIRNKGEIPVTFVKIEASFKDKKSTVIDKAWSYGVGEQALSPGEAKSFSVFADDDPRAISASADIITQ